jgi:hypothetical protein
LGRCVKAARRERILEDYNDELNEVKDWRNLAHKVGYHEQISVDIQRLERSRRSANELLLQDEQLPDLQDEINRAFLGTGHKFNGDMIVENRDDKEFWQFGESA